MAGYMKGAGVKVELKDKGAPLVGSRNKEGPPPKGFSLLEVLIAFTILALGLGVLLQVFSKGINTATLSAHYGRATALAEAGIGLVGLDIPLEPGLRGGETEDGLRWQVQVTEVNLDDLLPGEAPMPAYLITSEVSWGLAGGSRTLSLSTLRLGDNPPEI